MSSTTVSRLSANLKIYNDGLEMATMDGLPSFEVATTQFEENSPDILINTMQLVEPRARMPIPNHLLQTSKLHAH